MPGSVSVDPVSATINAGANAVGAITGLIDQFIMSPAQAAQAQLANRQLDLQGRALDVQQTAINAGRQETLYRAASRRQIAALVVVALGILAGGAVLTTLAAKG